MALDNMLFSICLSFINRLIEKKSLDQFCRYFNGVRNSDKKIKIYFRKLVEEQCWPNVSLIHWLEQTKYSDYKIY